MNALSKLLTKVSKRILANHPTNNDMLEVVDRVVIWRNADYISDDQVDEIATVIPESEPESPEGPMEAAEVDVEQVPGNIEE